MPCNKKKHPLLCSIGILVSRNSKIKSFQFSAGMTLVIDKSNNIKCFPRICKFLYFLIALWKMYKDRQTEQTRNNYKNLIYKLEPSLRYNLNSYFIITNQRRYHLIPKPWSE